MSILRVFTHTCAAINTSSPDFRARETVFVLRFSFCSRYACSVTTGEIFAYVQHSTLLFLIYSSPWNIVNGNKGKVLPSMFCTQ